MKTNLLKITTIVRVPEEWDHDKCATLRAFQKLEGPKSARELGELTPPGPIDQAIEGALADLAARLAAIDPSIELVTEIQR